jgi:hypothetical protein
MMATIWSSGRSPIIAQICGRQKKILRRRSHCHDLFDFRYFGLFAIYRAADHHDRRRAVQFAALRGNLLRGHGRQSCTFGLHGRVGKRFALGALEHDEAPRLEASVVRRPRRRRQQNVEVLGSRSWLRQAAG